MNKSLHFDDEKSFITLKPVANVLKLFWQNLSYNGKFAQSDENHVEKSLMTFDTRGQYYKFFTAVSYEFS